MTRKIKYEFHELQSKDRPRYIQLRKETDPEVARRDAESHEKWLKKNPSYRHELYQRTKTWITRNCVICGRFTSKKCRKFCSSCENSGRDKERWNQENKEWNKEWKANYYKMHREKYLERSRRQKERQRIERGILHEEMGRLVLA